MGMEVLAFETQVDPLVQREFGHDPSFRDSLRSQAARALAEKTLSECALYERIDPLQDELDRNPCAPTRHRWRVGLQRDLSEIEARERQMDKSRRQGLLEAAAFLRSKIKLYDRASGHCKHVLIGQLDDMAKALDTMAIGDDGSAAA